MNIKKLILPLLAMTFAFSIPQAFAQDAEPEKAPECTCKDCPKCEECGGCQCGECECEGCVKCTCEDGKTSGKKCSNCKGEECEGECDSKKACTKCKGKTPTESSAE